jgi:PTS system mannose-specific IIA component
LSFHSAQNRGIVVMVQVLLLTRGGLAEEWLRATEAVCGSPVRGIETLALDWDGGCDSDSAHVRKAVLSMRDRGPLLILTDLHGSTPTNLALEHAKDEGVAVVAGANLAMVVRLACDDRSARSPAELGEWICAKGRASIQMLEAAAPTVDETGESGER